MTPDNTIKYIINLKLMKLTGLYQLLNPENPKSFGCNIFKLGGILAVVYLILIIIMCNLSIYYSLNDFTEVVKYIMLIIATLFASTKMCFVILYSNELWKCISFTSIDYLSYKGHKKYMHIKARKLSKSISNIFTLAWIAVILVWILSPIIIKDNFMNVKSKDDTYNQYRYNMLNLIFPVPAQFYNNNFKVFYFFESIALIVYGYSMMVFDCLVISMCITITYQLKSIALSYSTLGYKDIDTGFKSKLYFLSIQKYYVIKSMNILFYGYLCNKMLQLTLYYIILITFQYYNISTILQFTLITLNICFVS